MRPRTTPMPLEQAIQNYVLKNHPNFVVGDMRRIGKHQFNFFFGKNSAFWIVVAKVAKTMGFSSEAEIEKLEDALYDEAILNFDLRVAELRL